MLSPLPIVLLAFLGAAGSCLGTRIGYVVGGQPVDDATSWPWQGSVKFLGSHECGCILISTTWAASAAHCMTLPAEYYTIRFGTVDLTKGTSVIAKKIIRHEDYEVGPGQAPNDLAVIQFLAFSITDKIRPIPLASTDDWTDSECWITGWGYIMGNHTDYPEQLQEASMSVITNEKCAERVMTDIMDGQICASDADGASGACVGDGGGPLVCSKSGSYQLVGVTSWGSSTCDPAYPTIFTRIYNYLDWIKEKTGI